MTYRRVYPPHATFHIYCTCHRANSVNGTSTVPGLVREGWFVVR